MAKKIIKTIDEIVYPTGDKIVIGWAKFPANGGKLELAFRYEYLDKNKKVSRMSPTTPLRLLGDIVKLSTKIVTANVREEFPA